MKIIYNKYLPFKGFCTINLFGVLFARSECNPVVPHIINHKKIHTAQMKELLYIGFYVAYLFEWLYRLVFHTETAYKGISFEAEAYANQYDFNYLKTRKRFAQWRK